MGRVVPRSSIRKWKWLIQEHAKGNVRRYSLVPKAAFGMPWGCCGYLGSALWSALSWPTKRWVTGWWMAEPRRMGSICFGRLPLGSRRENQVSSVGWIACYFLCIWVFINSWAVTNGLVIWWQWGTAETELLKGCYRKERSKSCNMDEPWKDYTKLKRPITKTT